MGLGLGKERRVEGDKEDSIMGICIAFVDDDPLLLHSCARPSSIFAHFGDQVRCFLSYWGQIVGEIESSGDLRPIVEGPVPDIVFCDLYAPGGILVLEDHLRWLKDQEYPGRVIPFSAGVCGSDRVRVQEIMDLYHVERVRREWGQFADYGILMKPCSPEILHEIAIS